MNLSFWTEPWAYPTTWWLVATAALTSISCGIPGTYLVLRRMSLTGDAIGHSVLPGIVIGFLVSGSLDSPYIILGAALSGWLTVILIDILSRKTGVREDAATGVVFTAMFSLGILLMRLFSAKIDLDPECVLFGNLETAIHGTRTTIGSSEIPNIALTTGSAAIACLILATAFHHRLLSTSFDPVLARLTGQSPPIAHSFLLALTAAVIVTAFQCVGAIMAVALLVLPPASALLIAKRLPTVLLCVVIHSILAAILGLYLATATSSNLGAATILSGAFLFLLALAWNKLAKSPTPR